MACEEKEALFNAGLLSVQSVLKSELEAIAIETEAKANEIANDLNADNDLAQGIGASAGTVIGGLAAGPPGALVGGALGKIIGSLFTLEIGMKRETVSLNVPQVTVKTKAFSFDVPTVIMRDKDLIFDVPQSEIRTVRGPDIPTISTRWEQRCIGPVCTDVPIIVTGSQPTYYDTVVIVMRPIRIVIGVPEVTMDRHDWAMDVPEFTNKSTEFSLDIPSVTIRFIKDAGRKTAALAASLAQSAKDAAERKQIEFKERLKTEVAPLLMDMYKCHRSEMLNARAALISIYKSQIDTLSLAVAMLAAKGLQDDHTDMKAAKNAVSQATKNMNSELEKFDVTLSEFDRKAEKSIKEFLGSDAPIVWGTMRPKFQRHFNLIKVS